MLVVACRLILIPALGLVAMIGIEQVFAGEAPLISTPMRAVILLQLASPSANNVIVLCQRLGLANLAEDLATIYVPMYLLCLLTVPAYLSIGLYIF